MGGLSRKFTTIQQINSQKSFGSLLVDSGNSLFTTTAAVDTDSEKAVIARGILKIYKKMGYDAVNIGPKDISAGLSFFKDIDAPPLISANFFDNDDKVLFLPQIIKQVGTLRYGITGVTRQPENLEKPYTYKEWQTVLPDIIDSLAKQSDFIILLSALEKTENTAIAERFPEIRMILSAGSGGIRDNDGMINNALLAQTVNRGRHLGQIRVEHPEYPQWQSETQKQILQLRQHLEMLKKKAKEYQQHSTDKTLQDKEQVLARLQQRIIHTSKRLEKLTVSLPENSQLTASTYTLRYIPLTSSIEEHPQIEEMIDKIHREVKTANDLQRKKSRQAWLTKKYSSHLAGSARCGQCHEKQLVFWRHTPHSRSFKTLEAIGKESNSSCLACHLTLTREDFRRLPSDTSFLLSFSDTLRSVGCEVCHEGNPSHLENPERFSVSSTVNAATCLSCHTPAHDGDFHYQQKKARIACPTT